MKKNLPFIIMICLMALGFYFRYLGISKNLSFWNDEIHAAIFSRAILWYGKPVTEIGLGTGLYQSIFYYITALSFRVFGINEFAGRLPSVLVGTIFIGIVFYLTAKLVNYKAAFVAAFLTAFSQIQLAWSTQLRPYIWLELFTFLVTYLAYKSITNTKTTFDKNLFIALIISIIASLFHGTGLINIILIIITLVIKTFMNRKFRSFFWIVPLLTIMLLIVYFSLSPIHRSLANIFHFDFYTLHYRVFLKANYWWLLAGAFVGSIYLFKTNKKLCIVLAAFTVTIFFLAIFKINPRYIRYSLPAFPLLYVLFGIGISFIARLFTQHIKHNSMRNIASYVLIFLILYAVTLTGKILLRPAYFYTINGDMRENPIVDYKKGFSIIKELIKDKKDAIVMDAWNDRVPWYLPKQKFIFLIEYRVEDIDSHFGEKLLSTVDEFEKEKKRYRHGVVLVENWESQTSIELQQHIQKTLKHQSTINNLPYNDNDKWSISIYSWGI